MYEYYELLGVDRDADTETIEAAFRERVQDLHPDQAGDSEALMELKRAREVLTDPALRKDYDRLGHREFLNRERGGPARDVDLRSTDDRRNPESRKRSRTHTRPRQESEDRGRSDRTAGRTRSPGGSGSSRSRSPESGSDPSRARNAGSSADRVPDSGPAPDQPAGSGASTDGTTETDPSRSRSGTQDAGDSRSPPESDRRTPAEGTHVATDDEGFDSVVDLDDVADVGSVDPDEVLGETSLEADVGETNDRASREDRDSNDPPEPNTDGSENTAVESGPTGTPSEQAPEPDPEAARSGATDSATTPGSGPDDTASPDESTTASGTADGSATPSGTADGSTTPSGTADGSVPSDEGRPDAKGSGPGGPGKRNPASDHDDTAPDAGGAPPSTGTHSTGASPSAPDNVDDPGVDPTGSSGVDPASDSTGSSGVDPASDSTGSSGVDPASDSTGSSGVDPTSGSSGVSGGPTDLPGESNNPTGTSGGESDPIEASGGSAASTDPPDDSAGPIGSSNDPTEAADPSHHGPRGGTDPATGPSGPADEQAGADPIGGPSEATGGPAESDPIGGPPGEGGATAESDGGASLGVGGATEPDGGEASGPGLLARLVGGLLAGPAAVVSAIPSPGIGARIDALRAVFGDEYRSDEVDQMARYAWIGRGVIAAVLWLVVSVIAPDTGVVPSGSSTALGGLALSLGVAFVAYDLLLWIVADLEPGCHGPAREDPPIAGTAGFVLTYVLATGGLAWVAIDAPALRSALVGGPELSTLATTVPEHPYHAGGVVLSVVVAVVSLAGLFVASLYLPWTDRFDRGYRVLPGLWQLPLTLGVVTVAWTAFTGGTVTVPVVDATVGLLAAAGLIGALPLVALGYVLRRGLETPRSRQGF